MRKYLGLVDTYNHTYFVFVRSILLADFKINIYIYILEKTEKTWVVKYDQMCMLTWFGVVVHFNTFSETRFRQTNLKKIKCVPEVIGDMKHYLYLFIENIF